ncbi:MAG: DUF2807 domain-containing protein [Alistipes sp.]|nr:DUF2807 domain-containing protein [Alistipes sp.]
MNRVILTLCTLMCSLYAYAQEPVAPVSNPVKEFLSSFSAINVDAPIKLELVKIDVSEAPYVIYDTKGVETSKFSVEVDSKSKTLKISERSDPKRESVTEVKVYFSELTDISISKANVTVEGVIESQLLDLYISNDAHFVAEVDVLDLMTTAAGKSRIMLMGSARYQTADISASEYDAGRLETISTIAEASHNAVVKVNAEERLEAKTATGGKIFYTIRPVILRSEITLFGGEITQL